MNKLNDIYRRYGKRFFDLFISASGLIILSPVILIVSVLVWSKLGSPILFKQRRPGKDGNIFLMYKFRTMSDCKDEHGNLLPDKDRLTIFGKFLRSTSLDELPELFNVFIGNMSVVGPRPLLEKYIPLYSHEQFRRHNVLPGITGWAQVNGRNSISWQEKFEYDVDYVDHYSFSLDLKILVMTICKVFKREGISSGTSATMEEFYGN